MSEDMKRNEEKALADEALEGVTGGEGIPWSKQTCDNCGVHETYVKLRNADGPNKFGLWGETKLLCPQCFQNYFEPLGWVWLEH